MAIGIQNQYFGTEIEMTGITRQRAAEAVAELFGTRAVYDGGYYQTWSVMDREGKKWKFMYDGSIYTQRRERGQMVHAGSESLVYLCDLYRFGCSVRYPEFRYSVERCSICLLYLRGYYVPTIFAISLRGLGDYTKRASSFLMMSPIGGAVGPLLMGYVPISRQCRFRSFVPLFGYAVVLIYSYMVMAKKLR